MYKRPNSRRGPAWDRTSLAPAMHTLPIREDEDQRPSRRRLRRLTEWERLGAGQMVARIIVLQHGGRQRPVIHRGSKHSRFKFLSTKTHTLQLGEGLGEEFLAQYNDVACSIVDYECHPFQIEVNHNGKVWRYRPDSVRQHRSGAIELIEVKRSDHDLADEEYRERLAVVAEIARRCGWTFVVLDDAAIFATAARQVNIANLFGRRSMKLSAFEENVMVGVLREDAPISWGDLLARLVPDDPLRGHAVIEHLLACGALSADLDLTFTSRTMLTPERPFSCTSEIRL